MTAGGRPRAQVGSGVQVELAPHVAGRASFTALTGGGVAERAHGSCDRRLAKYRRAQQTSARARPSRPSPCTSAERRGGHASGGGGGAQTAAVKEALGGVSACAAAVGRPCLLPYLMNTGQVLTQN